MSRKKEAAQRAAEEKILKYKAVVDYLKTKTDPSSLPVNNIVTISNILTANGWEPRQGGLWFKGGQFKNLIEAGIQEFQTQYDRLRQEHLKRNVKNFKEG